MQKIKLIFSLLTLSAFVISPRFAYAKGASFDCAKAASPIEKLICSDQELSDLDEKLSKLYGDLTRSAAYTDLKETQRAWLKERNKCSEIACMKSRYSERIAALTSPPEPPHYKLPPLDGIKHGATKEVFDKLINDYKSRPYQVLTERDGTKADNMGGHCMDFLNALRNGAATYVAPTFITDDYNDSRLVPYKEKYRAVIKKKDWASIPGADWFGGWVEIRRKILRRPTRNFALYEMDFDNDKENEIIFYGEFWVTDPRGFPGSPDGYEPMGGPSGYQIFKKLLPVGVIATPSEYDYDKGIHLNNYTTVFRYENVNYVAVSYLGSDFTRTTIDKLGARKGTDGKTTIYSGYVCQFDLGKNN